MNNAVFGKIMENVIKHTDINFIAAEKRRSYLASELNYQTTIFFSENLIATEMRKSPIVMNKPVYL